MNPKKPNTTTLESPMSVLTEVVYGGEAELRTFVEEDGEQYVNIKDIVGLLMEFSALLQPLGGLQQHIGDAIEQIAVQIATPFLLVDQEAPEARVLTLHTSPLGGGE